MKGIAGYLLGVICAAMVCALVEGMAGEGPGKKTRSLLCGAFMTLTVLSPLTKIELPEFDISHLRSDAQAAVREGEEQAEQAKRDIISEACEAYIWNKAGELGLDVQVRVELDDDGLPVGAELSGGASPLERQKLSSAVERELGIGEEDVIWTGMHQSGA